MCLPLKYGLVGHIKFCYCFSVVDVVPTGQIKSKRLSSYLEEVETKKKRGRKFVERGKKDATGIVNSISGRNILLPILISF